MVLNMVTGIDPQTGMALTALFVVAYTALAGMLSVAYTDYVNGVILTVGILIAVPMVINEAGGWEAISTSLPPGYFSVFHGETEGVGALNLFLPTLFLLLGEANMYGRFFSAESEDVAHRAVLWWIAGVMIIETSVVVIGTAGRALYPDIGSIYPDLANASEMLIPHMILSTLHPLFGALLLATMAAVIVSTADSFLLTPATNLQHDVWERFVRGWIIEKTGWPRRRTTSLPSEKERLWFLRVVVLLLGVWAYLQVTLFQNVLQAALYAYTMYGAGVTPAVLAAFFWKRATPAAGACSVGAGMAVTILWEFVAQPHLGGSVLQQVDPVVPALCVSLLTLVLVSLAGAKPSPDKWMPFFNEGDPSGTSR